MRTYRHRPSSLLLLIAVLILVIINSRSVASSARAKVLDAIAAPLSLGGRLAGAAGSLVPWRGLRAENARLLNENELLARKLGETKILVTENARLKGLLNFRATVPYTTIPAQVIGRDPTNWSNSIIIDKGAAAGIRTNRAVLSTRGLVGRVLELGRSSGKILLITDPNSKVGVLLQRTGQGGILIGRPDGNAKMIYIALDADVRPGDTVVTAGFGTIFPKGIMVGEVAAVDREPGRLYKSALVRPAQDMAKLEEVLCIK